MGSGCAVSFEGDARFFERLDDRIKHNGRVAVHGPVNDGDAPFGVFCAV